VRGVGPDYVGIGLGLTDGRSCVLKDASGHSELVAAVKRITAAKNVRKIAGENWAVTPDGSA